MGRRTSRSVKNCNARILILTARTGLRGHTHYTVNIVFNLKDTNTIASACLDRTIEMWSLGSSTANFTTDPHEKGVIYVDFYPCADKPYLVITGDDKTVEVWDYLSKSCVHTMGARTSSVFFFFLFSTVKAGLSRPGTAAHTGYRKP